MNINEFNTSNELIEMLRRFAEESGMAASDIVDAAVRDYLSRRTDMENADSRAVLSAADARIRQSPVFIVAADSPGYTLIVKSPLQYLHRPAIKYSIELNRADPGYLGRISVVLRSRDIRAQQFFYNFITIWTGLEQEYFIGRHRLQASGRQTDTTRFLRDLYRLPGGGPPDSQKTGSAIGEYVSAFDATLKLYLNTGCDSGRIEREYLLYLRDGKLTV